VPPRNRLRRALRATLPPAAALLLFFAAWDLSVRFFRIPAFLLPAPEAILSATAAVWENVAMHAGATIVTVAGGFLASALIGIPLALLLASSDLLGRALNPLIILVQSVPKVALAPILVVALGANEMPRIVIAFLVAFFPVVISTTTGLLTTPKEMLEFSRSIRASRPQQLFRVQLPYAVPHIFSGLKVAATLAVIGAVVAEFVAADSGLGYLLLSATAFFNTPLAFGAMLLLSVIAILVFQLVELTQRVFFRWSVGRATDP
jgi:NitT/TauT family transport system permease protein